MPLTGSPGGQVTGPRLPRCRPTPARPGRFRRPARSHRATPPFGVCGPGRTATAWRPRSGRRTAPGRAAGPQTPPPRGQCDPVGGRCITGLPVAVEAIFPMNRLGRCSCLAFKNRHELSDKRTKRAPPERARLRPATGAGGSPAGQPSGTLTAAPAQASSTRPPSPGRSATRPEHRSPSEGSARRGVPDRLCHGHGRPACTRSAPFPRTDHHARRDEGSAAVAGAPSPPLRAGPLHIAQSAARLRSARATGTGRHESPR